MMGVSSIGGNLPTNSGAVARPAADRVDNRIEGDGGARSLAGATVAEDFGGAMGGIEVASAAGVQVPLERSDHPASISESLSAPFAKMGERRQELEELVKDLEDGKLDRLNGETMVKFLHLQMGMQEAAMNVELVSKTVEMGTSGTKTLLQTQA